MIFAVSKKDDVSRNIRYMISRIIAKIIKLLHMRLDFVGLCTVKFRFLMTNHLFVEG